MFHIWFHFLSSLSSPASQRDESEKIWCLREVYDRFGAWERISVLFFPLLLRSRMPAARFLCSRSPHSKVQSVDERFRPHHLEKWSESESWHMIRFRFRLNETAKRKISGPTMTGSSLWQTSCSLTCNFACFP
jgi:hypothetical protein